LKWNRHRRAQWEVSENQAWAGMVKDMARRRHKGNEMRTLNVENVMLICGYLAPYVVSLGLAWKLMQRRRKSRDEKALNWRACYIKLSDLAKSHRLRAARFEIQAEKIRLKWQREERALRRRMYEEMFYKK
jgi:hypothetical protein